MSKDFFGKNADELKEKALFLLDMDGTIYNENAIFEGTIEFLDLIVKQGGKYVFITNNSSKSSKAYVEKLERMGIKANDDDIFSSIDATIILLKELYSEKLVYVQGTKSFIEELKENDIRVTEEVEDDIGVVLTGFDTELNFDKLNKTCEILTKRDLPYYATNPDLVCPVSYGFVPDNGSVAIMIENATKKKPIFIGKPQPTMIDLVCEKYHTEKKKALIIGDRLYTDIASGLNAKVDTVCVLTGEATLDDLKKTQFVPDYVFKSVIEITEAIRKVTVHTLNWANKSKN